MGDRMRIFCILMCLVASTAGAGTYQEILDQLGHPTLASDAHAVQNFGFTLGNATFTISGETEGIIAAGHNVGFAFSGAGKVAVAIEKGPFYQANQTTMEAKVNWKGGDVFSETFTSAVFFTNTIPDGLLGAEHKTASKLGEVLERSIERWNETPYTKLDHILASSLFNSFPGTQAMAFLWDGKKDSIYFCDEIESFDSQFAQWDKFTQASMNFAVIDTLIDQPVSFDPKRRPVPPAMQTNIDLEIVTSDNLFMKQKLVTEVTAMRTGLQVVSFNLLNGRSENFRQMWDERDDQLHVKSVKTSDGLSLDFSHKYDELLIKLPRTMMAGQKISLEIKCEGKFLENYAGDSYLVLGNMAYFPQFDIYTVKAPFHAVLKVKEPYTPLGCGVNLRRWKEGDLNCIETRETMNMSFPFLVMGKFEVAEKQKDRYDLKVYSYAMAKNRGAKNLLRNGLAVLDFYSNGMEPFPYKELEVVEIPYYRHFFWQAPAGIVEITSEGLSPMGGDSSDENTLIARYAKKGQNARYAHEIAHQWFGNLVSWATPYDNWISESFAEYLSYMFMSEGAKDKKKAKVQLKAWQQDTDECSDLSSIYGAGSLGGSRTIQRCYTQLLYGKGPYVLHALRQDMGDQNFKKMLYFLTTQAAKKDLKVITEDVILFANAVSGKDYHDWFDRYIFGTEIPPLK